MYTYPLKTDVEVDSGAQAAALRAIVEERRQQEAKHGFEKSCANPDVTLDRKMTILTEEVGEVAMAINDGDLDGVRDELIQVAAVAVAILEAISG